MARTKTRLNNGYTRVRTVSGTTVTTHFVPRNAMPLRERFRQMEHQILRNLIIIQEFNLVNSTGPISIDHARAQRQRYEIIRENCEITTTKVNHALQLSDNDQICSQAFHGIFITLKTMLNNEVTRAEAINLRAVKYWHQNVVPDPPKHSKLTEQRSYESAIHRRIFQHVDLTSDSSSDNDTNHDFSPRYSPKSPQTPQ
jgi:hypothetical protein